jgi:hypothetical protein
MLLLQNRFTPILKTAQYLTKRWSISAVTSGYVRLKPPSDSDYHMGTLPGKKKRKPGRNCVQIEIFPPPPKP